MKVVLTIGVLMFAMTFCGLQERLKSVTGGNANSPASSDPNAPPGGWADGGRTPPGEAEKASMTPAQQAIADAGTETKWEAQDISWKLPAGWEKIKVDERMFNYGSADNAFIIVSVSELPDSFPADLSLKGTYESAVGRTESGEYEKARMLEIDGLRGAEWTEAMPSQRDDPRRHQWIAFRERNGKNQQLNVILSTKGSNFDKHRDDFAAVMYSVKIPK
ncbi:MAG: hypothetical protein IPM59_14185 [Chloracidobacterium sp.]|nr:hypothetical protein [Chloracidobacterium sp.]